jgi:tetratricopeptide (TPR) repeat protein
MGLLDWIRPSPEKRLARARELLESGHAADARLDALALGDLAGAREVVDAAEAELARLNLAAAAAAARAGDLARARFHHDLAVQYRKPGLEADFVEVEAEIRGEAALRDERARALRRAEAERLLEVNPGFREARAEELLPLPEGLDEDEADALRARLALVHEGYAPPLRDRMVVLGPAFAQAVLDLDEGRAEAALPALLALPDEEPLVLHERARAAHALGDPASAARAWRAFADRAGGHHPMGPSHTAVLLAQVEAEVGRLAEALAVIEAADAAGRKAGAGLRAQLLEGLGRLAEAEGAWRDLLRSHGPHPAIYLALARVRLRGGHRVAAMQALETCLDEARCSGGRCGHVPPPLEVYRSLATLYLEDGHDVRRGLEVAGEAHARVQEPTWDDVFLLALVTRARDSDGWPEIVDKLRAADGIDASRRQRLEAAFPAA